MPSRAGKRTRADHPREGMALGQAPLNQVCATGMVLCPLSRYTEVANRPGYSHSKVARMADYSHSKFARSPISLETITCMRKDCVERLSFTSFEPDNQAVRRGGTCRKQTGKPPPGQGHGGMVSLGCEVRPRGLRRGPRCSPLPCLRGLRGRWFRGSSSRPPRALPRPLREGPRQGCGRCR